MNWETTIIIIFIIIIMMTVWLHVENSMRNGRSLVAAVVIWKVYNQLQHAKYQNWCIRSTTILDTRFYFISNKIKWYGKCVCACEYTIIIVKITITQYISEKGCCTLKNSLPISLSHAFNRPFSLQIIYTIHFPISIFTLPLSLSICLSLSSLYLLSIRLTNFQQTS